MKIKLGVVNRCITDFGTGTVIEVDKKGETARVLLDNNSIVNVLVSELRPIKRYKLLGA